MRILLQIIRGLRYFGLYTFRGDKNFYTKQCFFSLIGIMYVYFILVNLLDLLKPRDIFGITQIIFFINGALTGMTKFFNFHFQKNLIRSILLDLEESTNYSVSLDELNIIRKKEGLVKWLHLLYSGFALATITIVVISALVFGKLIISICDISCFNDESTYYFFYVLQSLCTISIGVSIANLDVFFYGLFIMIAGQFEVLALRLKKLGNSKIQLNSCIKHHVLLKTIVKKTEKFFRIYMFVFFMTNVFDICMATFQLLMVGGFLM